MYTYLIIDDEELIRKGTIKKLKPLEGQVSCIGEAENGEDGIEKIKALHPDIVVLDMQMPVMDGTQLLPYLSRTYPQLPLIVISGYRDFDYVKHAISAQAIDYILKPFSRDAIQKCMLDAIARLENRDAIKTQLSNSEEAKENAYYEYDLQILKNLILGYHTDTAALSSKRLNFIRQNHSFLLLTLYFSTAPLEGGLENRLLEDFKDLALYLSNPNEQRMGFVILFLPEDASMAQGRLTRQMTAALLEFAREEGLSLKIGVSQAHLNLQELNDAFSETSGALNRQPLLGESSSYYLYQDVPPQNVTWERLDEFLFRLESGMKEEVQALTEELFSWFCSIPGFTLADVKYYCYFLSGQCRLILDSYLAQPEGKNASSSMQNVVNRIFTLKELKAYYLQFFLNLTSMLAPRSVYAVDDMIQRIQIYMQRNYQKDLTQDFVSFLFYLNRSYLSTLFKKRTGQKFVDYLNDIRIEKAKELLASSDRKMYQISKAVGYDNVKYFFRIFKKKTGVTPEQFRSSCQI